MVKVSVVIPVYNMEKYMDRCMQSVLGQTLRELEIILVDDGSKDASPAMCDAYAQKDARVRVLHKENGGLTSAWKAGSMLAEGNYIGYVDSDDFIEPDMFERLYERALETDADIVCCGLTHIYEDDPGRKWTEQMLFSKESLGQEDLKKEVFPGLINDGTFFGRHLMPNRVTKLTRASLVKENLSKCADEVSIGEDFQFSLSMFLSANRVEIIKDYYPYYYYMNGASMTMKHDVHYPDKIRIMQQNLCRISDEKGIYDLKPQIWNDFLCLTVLHIKGAIYKQKDKSYGVIRKELKQIIGRSEVQYALFAHTMNQLSLSEKLFVFFMKRRWYFCLYAAVRVYFR